MVNQERLFHITTREAWAEAKAGARVYRAPSLSAVGFIHLSTEKQWPHTQRRFYRGVQGLVLLVIDAQALEADVKFEAADGDAFPHLYGPLEIEAVVEVRPLEPVE